MEYYKEELCHHGILGQKWGKTNGPPYPLKVSDHSAAEKKAGWKKSLSKSEDNSITLANRTEKGKSAAKKALIGIGVLAIGTATVMALASSGAKYGAEEFNKELSDFVTKVESDYNGEKQYLPNGSVVLPRKEYGHVMHEIQTHMNERQKRDRQFTFPVGNKTYFVRLVKNDIPIIYDWSYNMDDIQELWEDDK